MGGATRTRLFLLAVLVAVAALVLPAAAHAVVPQDIGMPDVTQSPTSRCRECHGDEATDGAAHHAYVFDHGYQCERCHVIPGYGEQMVVDRNCTRAGCHPYGQPSPMHSVPSPTSCPTCHSGGVVEAWGEIPTAAPNERTPRFTACRNCHTAGTWAGTGIARPADTHHTAFPYSASATCQMCHDSMLDADAIRTCEACHSPDLLHSIAGHQGAQAVCEGCHGPGAMPPYDQPLAAPVLVSAVQQPSPPARVVVTGTGFGAARGETDAVYVDGVAAEVFSWTDTEIVIESGSFTGSRSIVVQTRGGVSNNVWCSFGSAAAITAIEPAHGQANAALRLRGTGFEDVVCVRFIDSTAMTGKPTSLFYTVSPEEIVCDAPQLVPGRTYWVALITGDGVSRPATYVVDQQHWSSGGAGVCDSCHIPGPAVGVSVATLDVRDGIALCTVAVSGPDAEWGGWTVRDGAGTYVASGMSPSDTFVVRAGGTYQVWAAAGANSAHTTFVAVADSTDPHTTLASTSTAGQNGWLVSDVTFTLTAEDSGSGVAKTEYSYDGTVWSAYAGPVTTDAEGEVTVRYRSIDRAGNVEDEHAQTFKVDTTPPNAEVSVPAADGEYWKGQTLLAAWTAEDAVSGIALAHGRTPSLAPVDTLTSGWKPYFLVAQDVAGNVADLSFVYHVYLDALAPITSALVSGTEGENGWYLGSAQVAFTAGDGPAPASGVAATEYSLDGAAWTAWTGQPFTITGRGTHTVLYRSRDAAGNLESAQSLTVKVTAAPMVPTLSGPMTSNDGAVLVYGKADKGATVEVLENGALVGTAIADAAGNWHADVQLTQGTPVVTARAVRDEQTSAESDSISIVVQPDVPAIGSAEAVVGGSTSVPSPNTGVVSVVAMSSADVIDLAIPISNAPASAFVTLGGVEYALDDADGDGVFTASLPVVDLPKWQWFELDVTVTGSDGSGYTQTLGKVTLIDPSGYIYDLDRGTDARVPGATVTLYAVGETGPWDAAQFGQVNPQTTGADGRYGWDVPEGDYYITIARSGYEATTSRVVHVPPPVLDLDVGIRCIDAEPPVVTVHSPSAFGVYAKGAIAFDFEVADPLSGVLATRAYIESADGAVTDVRDGETLALGSGVYTLHVVATDTGRNETDSETMFVVYDPDGGFVSGGGWITPVADPSAEGFGARATFGFVSKYLPGRVTPSGNLQFEYRFGAVDLKSTSMEWLAVADNAASFQGLGTLGGSGSYKYRVDMLDGAGIGKADHFRIRIWGGQDAGLAPRYDFEGDLGGGSVVVHKK